MSKNGTNKQGSTKLVVIAALAICAVLFILNAIPQQPQTYMAKCFVSNVNGNNVCVVREDGLAYSFHGKGYAKWQHLNIAFSDNGTSDVYDDVMVEIY